MDKCKCNFGKKPFCNTCTCFTASKYMSGNNYVCGELKFSNPTCLSCGKESAGNKFLRKHKCPVDYCVDCYLDGFKCECGTKIPVGHTYNTKGQWERKKCGNCYKTS